MYSWQRQEVAIPPCANGSKISFTPKGGIFCENNFLKLLIGSLPIYIYIYI